MKNNSQQIEEWRDVEGYDGLYQVSSLGRVRSLDRYESCNGGTRLRKGRVLRPGRLNCGYLILGLNKDKKQKMFKVHRLVGMAFQDICGKYKYGLEIDHRNCVRDDNRAVNLHWVTRKENNNNPLTRQCRSNLMKGENAPWYGKFGKDNPASKAILQYDLEGNFIAEFDSITSAERQLGILNQNICNVLKGRQKTAGGYIFRYKTS